MQEVCGFDYIQKLYVRKRYVQNIIITMIIIVIIIIMMMIIIIIFHFVQTVIIWFSFSVAQ
jgi:hypothetical protein